jgi:hypothetical protein
LKLRLEVVQAVAPLNAQPSFQVTGVIIVTQAIALTAIQEATKD